MSVLLMNDKLVDAVVALVSHTAPATVGTVTDYDRSLFDLGLDSLDHSALLLAIEERYGIKIPDADVERLDTVNRIAAYVAERHAAPVPQ
jgi:acyl carrier protein